MSGAGGVLGRTRAIVIPLPALQSISWYFRGRAGVALQRFTRCRGMPQLVEAALAAPCSRPQSAMLGGVLARRLAAVARPSRPQLAQAARLRAMASSAAETAR
jgi:hypothetical protein